MTRLLEQKREERQALRINALVKALEFGLVGALESQGVEFLGFSVKYNAFNCLMTLRADLGGKRHVAHVGSDSIINCILKAENDASHDALVWVKDKYHQ